MRPSKKHFRVHELKKLEKKYMREIKKLQATGGSEDRIKQLREKLEAIRGVLGN